jgi:hypothetical protein
MFHLPCACKVELGRGNLERANFILAGVQYEDAFLASFRLLSGAARVLTSNPITIHANAQRRRTEESNIAVIQNKTSCYLSASCAAI